MYIKIKTRITFINNGEIFIKQQNTWQLYNNTWGARGSSTVFFGDFETLKLVVKTL